MLRRENLDIQGWDISQTQSRALINYSSQLTSDFTPNDDCPQIQTKIFDKIQKMFFKNILKILSTYLLAIT